MRRYDIVAGILAILFIIDFALAAPVLAQEKIQARVDMVHMPNDLITVLGKRSGDELEELLEGFRRLQAPTTSSSSSAPLGGLDNGLTNVVSAAPNIESSTANRDPLIEMMDSSSTDGVYPPAPNPASSTAIQDPLIEMIDSPSSSPSTVSMQSPSRDGYNALGDDVMSYDGDDELHGPPHAGAPEYSSDDGSAEAEEHMQPNYYSSPWTDSAVGSDPDRGYYTDPGPPSTWPHGFGPAYDSEW
ncbi:hypothetical protein BGY98DRAFT_1178392 [Russula aff. rugulosa BPL654]|nr:hypothetical protein BGY98DRAFT_1178392 [Russula aff. rugulosa BPL654]